MSRSRPMALARWCAAVLATVVVALPAVAARQARVTILFTSDLHAHALPFDDIRERPLDGSIAQVATVVKAVRHEGVAPVVLDGGDAIEGTALEYYAIAAGDGEGADPTIAAMNIVGYDAAAVGNHEFNFGLDVLRRSLSQSKFPWLAANLEGAKAARLPISDEIVLDRRGIRIGVIGLTNPNIPNWDPREHLGALTFDDPVAVATARVAALRPHVDVVVVVAHTGFERDPASGEPEGGDDENFAWRLAHVPGIDVLLTGHTHRNIPPRLIGGTIVAQPGRWGDHVTRIDLTLARRDRRWAIASWNGENIATAGMATDAAVVAAVTPAHEHALERLSERVGTLAEPLEIHGVMATDDASVDLLHAVQLEASGAQLSLAAPLGVSATRFPAGPVTRRLVHALYRYPNTLVVVRLTGTQVAAVLEHAVSGWTGVKATSDGKFVVERDPKVPGYSFDTLEGATYVVDPTAPVGQRVTDLRYRGEPLDPHAIFTVVINSYRAAGGGGYPYLRDAERAAVIDRPMVELIAEYFRRHGEVDVQADENWVFTLPFTVGVARHSDGS